jgi:hypothetical protein
MRYSDYSIRRNAERRTPPRRTPRVDGGLLLAAGCGLLAALGCAANGDGWRFAQGWSKPHMPWSADDEDEPQRPERLVATWTDATHSRPGEPPQRGFGGRIVFFQENSETPVRVDGQLVVYAYDETERQEHDVAPTRRYIFPAEQFVKHESASQLGPSYSVWLPWDQVGGPSRKVSLIARFEPREGGLVLSEQTHHFLPGPDLGPAETSIVSRQATSDSVRQVAHLEPAAPASPAEAKSRPTAIRLSPQMVNRLARRSTADAGSAAQ